MGEHICMHSRAIREQALVLVRSGLNDCEVARRTGISRTTIRDWRRPRYRPRARSDALATCPRCGRSGRRMSFTPGDYAELLGLYLGDGHISRMPRTWHLRIFLDSKYPQIIDDAENLLERCLGSNRVGRLYAHDGRMTILSVYSQHLRCLFPQHGPGKKHERPITLERWQERMLDDAPWRFLRGCIRSDGCSFVNRTGRYEYLSYEFSNRSSDILDLFGRTCETVGVEYRRYAKAIRIYRRPSVGLMETHVGLKR
jgi:Homeodomain-like domain